MGAYSCVSLRGLVPHHSLIHFIHHQAELKKAQQEAEKTEDARMEAHRQKVLSDLELREKRRLEEQKKANTHLFSCPSLLV